MKNYFKFLFELDQETKRNTFLILFTYFLVLFSYPLVRSSTGTLFYEAYSASEYSMASFIGVVVLMALITINNKLQPILGVQKVYLFTGVLTIVGFLGSYFAFTQGIKPAAYALFAIKESYIVLLVHLCLAFANTFYPIDLFKRVIGPIGAVGSVGGIIGGQLTSYLAKKSSFGTDSIFFISLGFILLTLIVFYGTKRINTVKTVAKNNSVTPIEAISGVRGYVFLIAAIVMLSQFVIFIADLQFNMIFVETVTEKDARTAYLGNFYSLINLISFILQFIVLPILLIKFRTRNIFMFVPILYVVLVFGGLGFGAGQIFVVGAVFIMMKGTDYSIFSIAKEVMYHPLLSIQKYGAKYITDMFVYRTAKALIAFLMAQAFMNSYTSNMTFLSILQFIFLALWIILVFGLFREQEKLNLTEK